MDKRRAAEIIGVVYCVIGLIMVLMDNVKTGFWGFTVPGLLLFLLQEEKTIYL